VTQINGQLVRPHDVEISSDPPGDGVPATVARVVRLGFEVRVEMRADGRDAWAQVTREFADHLHLKPGATVHLRVHPAARTLAAVS
jgi:sulfate transport system ATP-binding protein